MKLLVVVNVQDGFLTHPAARAAARNALTLARSEHYAEVWGTQFINPGHAGLFIRELGWRGMRAGDPGTDLWAPLEGDLDRVVETHTYGLPPSGLRELAYQRPERIDLVGLETDGSVTAIAFQLFDRGLPVRVLSNACATSSGDAAHRQALALCRRRFGDASIVDVDTPGPADLPVPGA